MKPLKKLVLALMAGIFLFYCSADQTSTYAAPKLVLKEKAFDFQEVTEGQTLEHDFVIRNQGDQPLTIQDVKTGWGCTVASYDKAILPGGEGKIKIQVQTSGREGLLEKTASIYNNDPSQPITTIMVKAQIKPVIILTPTHLQLSAKKGEPLSGEVEIKANIDKPLTLKPGLFNLAERLTYTLTEVEKGKKFLVRFKRAHGLTEPLQGYLYLETNYPEKPQVTIFIQCNLIQPN